MDFLRPVKTDNGHKQMVLDLDLASTSLAELPVKVGGYFVAVYKVVGYYRDSNGGLLAEIDQVDKHGNTVRYIYDAVELKSDEHVLVQHPSYLFDSRD